MDKKRQKGRGSKPIRDNKWLDIGFVGRFFESFSIKFNGRNQHCVSVINQESSTHHLQNKDSVDDTGCKEGLNKNYLDKELFESFS